MKVDRALVSGFDRNFLEMEIGDAKRRIKALFKLKQTPDDKTVKSLLSRLERYKRTGYVIRVHELRTNHVFLGLPS